MSKNKTLETRMDGASQQERPADRKLRPKRRISFKPFFKAPEQPVDFNPEGPEVLFPTPVSIEDTLSKTGVSTGVPTAKRGSLITPLSISDSAAFLPTKKRRIALIKIKKDDLVAPVTQGKTPLHPSVFALNHRIRLKALMCSWTSRKDNIIDTPSHLLHDTYLAILQQPHPLKGYSEGPKIAAFLQDAFERSTLFRVQPDEISTMQKGRMINRDSLIRSFILPVINTYGMNYETLFIAVNVFDRFLAKSFMHKLAFYELAAIVSAFIAIKYNEEFDPVIKTSLTIADRVNVFYIKDFIAMERKIMATLDWDIRPVTPHVIAYKMLDEVYGFIPNGVKRFAVNIVERIVVGSYCSKSFFEGPWNLTGYTLTALQFAFRAINGMYFSLAFDRLETLVNRPLDWQLTEQQCIKLSEPPVDYRERIRLGDYV